MNIEKLLQDFGEREKKILKKYELLKSENSAITTLDFNRPKLRITLKSIIERSKLIDSTHFIEKTLLAISAEEPLQILGKNRSTATQHKTKLEQILKTSKKLNELILDEENISIEFINGMLRESSEKTYLPFTEIKGLLKNILLLELSTELALIKLSDFKNRTKYKNTTFISKLALIFESHGGVVSSSESTVFYDYVAACSEELQIYKSSFKDDIKAYLNSTNQSN